MVAAAISDTVDDGSGIRATTSRHLREVGRVPSLRCPIGVCYVALPSVDAIASGGSHSLSYLVPLRSASEIMPKACDPSIARSIMLIAWILQNRMSLLAFFAVAQGKSLGEFGDFRRPAVNKFDQSMLNDLEGIEQIVLCDFSLMTAGISQPLQSH